MENATKALLMAAGILIGILILSLVAYLYTSFSQTAAEVNQRNERQQLVQFNTQFTTYLGNENLTIYDVITVTNTAKENNNEYQDVNNYNTYYQITVFIGSDRIDNESQEELENRIKSNGLDTKYVCTGIEYHDASGRVSKVTFRQK